MHVSVTRVACDSCGRGGILKGQQKPKASAKNRRDLQSRARNRQRSLRTSRKPGIAPNGHSHPLAGYLEKSDPSGCRIAYGVKAAKRLTLNTDVALI